MGFLRFMKFLLALIVSALTYANFALADIIDDGLDVAPDIYEVQLDKTDFDTLGYEDYDRYPGDDQNFRCEIIVVIVDLDNNYKKKRYNFWGSGDSWSDSRNSAFQRYGRHINTSGFWRSRYNHSFAFKNCQG